MSGIKDYSTTQANNIDLNGIDTNEGMLPSNLNNAIRALMKNTRDWYNTSEWIEYGDGSSSYTAAYASASSLTINGVNVTSIYQAGRRIKVTASTPGTIYGTIGSSSFSTNTTVNITWDGTALSNEAITSVHIGVLSSLAASSSLPSAISATKIANGTISDAEFQYLNGVSSAIQTQINAKQATITGSATTIDTESLTANRAVISNGSQKIAVSDITSTELGYLDGVSSAIQTQINSKTTETYVNNAIAGLNSRTICRVATTANITTATDLQAGDSLDGKSLVEGNKVLVKNQTNATQNGIYLVAASGANAGRDPDFNTVAELAGQMMVVQEGSANADKLFLCTTDNSGNIGSVNIVFSQITPQNAGTVTQIGIADAGASEITVGNSPITSSGNITVGINAIANSKITGLGTAATKAVGTSANNVVQLDGNAKLPAVDGSALTNVGIQWQSVHTSNSLSVVAGRGYFINTASNVCTATLPSSPSIGNQVRFIDYGGTFDSNSLTIGRAGKKIMGVAQDLVVSTERAALGLVFVDDTQGWLLIEK